MSSDLVRVGIGPAIDGVEKTGSRLRPSSSANPVSFVEALKILLGGHFESSPKGTVARNETFSEEIANDCDVYELVVTGDAATSFKDSSVAAEAKETKRRCVARYGCEPRKKVAPVIYNGA